jgi:hypothetical protein
MQYAEKPNTRHYTGLYLILLSIETSSVKLDSSTWSDSTFSHRLTSHLRTENSELSIRDRPLGAKMLSGQVYLASQWGKP